MWPHHEFRFDPGAGAGRLNVTRVSDCPRAWLFWQSVGLVGLPSVSGMVTLSGSSFGWQDLREPDASGVPST